METAVFLKITGGKIIPKIGIDKRSTILELKAQLKTLLNMDISRQTLKFNNKEMMNHKIIADYVNKFGEDIVLEVTPLPDEQEFNILVSFCNQDVNVKVKEKTLVADLRAKMENFWGIPSNKNTSLYCGSTKMEDKDPLSDYYIVEGSQVLMYK